ncbi:dihydrofolate reductase family protein [Pseudoroseicyclus sp. CXY001]|uniref:dihydrofolate reductase family protein n=1 Tax=Pseudoroseicyclus sp. CXY001 TaxID=3242492 RepID=UPI00357131E7
MTRFVAYISMSLDGRIADADGGTSWLADHGGGEEGDRGYAAFHGAADAVVMGRRTHDGLREAGPWPWRGVPAYVITSRMLDPKREMILPVLPDFPGLGRQLRRQDYGTVWVVGGGQTLGAALQAGMLDELRLFVLPVVLGAGVPLFSMEGLPRPAVLSGHRLWPGGVVELLHSFDAGPQAKP